MMLVISGCSPFSAPKRASLLEEVVKLVPQATRIDALYLHFIHTKEENALQPTTPGRIVLDALLSYGDDCSIPGTRAALENPKSTNVIFVVPRSGSISPWSSKATDIANICDLGSFIHRIERGIGFVVTAGANETLSRSAMNLLTPLLHDKMTQKTLFAPPRLEDIFSSSEPSPLRVIDICSHGSVQSSKETLESANTNLGLALTQDEIDYLLEAFVSGRNAMKRNPTDAELFMFAQVNSEHCRHKVFNASWKIDGELRDQSLFAMIRNTESVSGSGTISAYSDNATVFEGQNAPRFSVDQRGSRKAYRAEWENMHILAKVETHNHPTAVSPYPGAATGSGGEIRDEGAVGRGSKPKAGLAGFSVSSLMIPGFVQPWETDFGRPSHIASALQIMMEGPLGSSAYNNEFGRPALTGYFRTFSDRIRRQETLETDVELRGYHKPIMVAGGLGNVRPFMAKKSGFQAGCVIIVLGGPGLLIGLGGGAASSQTAGSISAELDFASVQRDNAEIQRRCQEVIDACIDLNDANPIQSIHDVGAGGLSNALPELVHDADLGATFEIRDVLVDDTSMSPMEIWCNESQERYVLAVSPDDLKIFQTIAQRERCPYTVVGRATVEQRLIVTDRLMGKPVVDLDMAVLFGKPPKMTKSDTSNFSLPAELKFFAEAALATKRVPEIIEEAVGRVLRLPSVASKAFLITIGDRSITGLVTRDQMVGPWQVPVADVAVTRTSYGFDVLAGEAMAMGERPILALIDSAASARMAVGEAITNVAAASIVDISKIKLSANWMCASSLAGEGARLYEAVQAIGIDLCPALGIGIPVGKDSMSMAMRWTSMDGTPCQMTAPLSLIITAFAPVNDVGATWTPQLQRSPPGKATSLIFIDLAKEKQRLGGSALAQVYNELGSQCPDVEEATILSSFFKASQKLKQEGIEEVLAYHDRSDGGLLTSILEMAFAGRVGCSISMDSVIRSGDTRDVLSALFCEELGAVIQVREERVPHVQTTFRDCGFPDEFFHVIGRVDEESSDWRTQKIGFSYKNQLVFQGTLSALQSMWAETSFQMQSLRDDKSCAKEEYDLIREDSQGLFYDYGFSLGPVIPTSVDVNRPKVAILREQGINGQREMAWAFHQAGFEAVDVHMSDLMSGATSLAQFRGLAACGGFSYGDVLGAGNGWAKSIILHPAVNREFQHFFDRQDTFALAVCNGCQLFSHLKTIIRGADTWPSFKPNRSQRFEARVCMVEIVPSESTSSSVFLRHMTGARIPVAVAHGEGRATFDDYAQARLAVQQGSVAVRYIDFNGLPTERYPLNPNGSPDGLAGVQTPDGRVLALMPHPERVVSMESNSWYPSDRKVATRGVGPWFKLFQSAREWCT